jgi:formylglycine-generating enzyme required for sulfatase activity
MKRATLLFILTFSSLVSGKEVKLKKAVYAPIFRDPGEVNTEVGPLLADETPVTNRDFLEFVKARPEFAKSKIPPLYADDGYLSHWTGDQSFEKFQANFPVTHVSWFAARKYCEFKGKRLPTIAEWEVLSDARNPKLQAKILEWYAKPDSKLRPVGRGAVNRFGVKDAHGLVWEWVENFAETIMSSDSRGGSAMDSLFCGGAALKAKDPKLYAAFMRFAFRSSLTARYESANLGFRCVKDGKGNDE